MGNFGRLSGYGDSRIDVEESILAFLNYCMLDSIKLNRQDPKSAETYEGHLEVVIGLKPVKIN